MREDMKAKVDELAEQKEAVIANSVEKMLGEMFRKARKNKAMHDKKKHYYEADRSEADESGETGRQD